MAVAQTRMDSPLRVLIIEDAEDDALLLANSFKKAGYDLEYQRVDNASDTRAALQAGNWDVVLSDHRMPGFSAMGALKLLQELNLDLPFIIVSGVIDEETAIATMRAGAHDYLSKDKLDRLVPAVEREIREARNRVERRLALEAVKESEARFRALVSNIPGMVFQLLRDKDGRLHFPYVSDGCAAVLGARPSELVADPDLFFSAILSQDRHSLEQGLAASAHGNVHVNWDGRILSAAGDIKWINLRSAPRVLESGATQWEGIVSNITKSKLTEMELRESRAQLAELSSHLEAVKEEERERIARDIHDELGGTLVAIKIETSLLINKLSGDPLHLRKRVRAIESLVDEAINTASRVARELRPGILKDFGLAAALECQAGDFSQRTGIECDTGNINHEVHADDRASLALFRIFQEALTNILKHANASRVAVGLHQDDRAVVLEIEDDGKGIVPDDLAKPKSFGLRGIRERLNALGGTLDIGTGSLGGAHLILRVPRLAGGHEPALPAADSLTE